MKQYLINLTDSFQRHSRITNVYLSKPSLVFPLLYMILYRKKTENYNLFIECAVTCIVYYCDSWIKCKKMRLSDRYRQSLVVSLPVVTMMYCIRVSVSHVIPSGIITYLLYGILMMIMYNARINFRYAYEYDTCAGIMRDEFIFSDLEHKQRYRGSTRRTSFLFGFVIVIVLGLISAAAWGIRKLLHKQNNYELEVEEADDDDEENIEEDGKEEEEGDDEENIEEDEEKEV